MTYEDFSNRLKQLDLTREDFSKLVGMNYNSVANWKSKEIPIWVDTWLEKYEEEKTFSNVKGKITINKTTMENTRELLKQKYLMLNLRKPQDCLKLSYQYHQVKVNTYFDYYENTFNLFLVLSYERSYYFTPLNIDNLIVKNPYLNDIPKEILGQILDNGSLKDFYDNMREHMIHDDVQKSNYEDYEFKNGLKSNKNNDKNPFLSHLRKMPMSENHLNFLNTQFNISKYILQRIRAKGYTIVTTANFSERKSLTLILNESSIKL